MVSHDITTKVIVKWGFHISTSAKFHYKSLHSKLTIHYKYSSLVQPQVVPNHTFLLHFSVWLCNYADYIVKWLSAIHFQLTSWNKSDLLKDLKIHNKTIALLCIAADTRHGHFCVILSLFQIANWRIYSVRVWKHYGEHLGGQILQKSDTNCSSIWMQSNLVVSSKM